MRFVAVILVIVQLLLRGVAVPHCHAHDGVAQPAGHASTPHVHVLPHSHSHAIGQHGSQHCHSHRHVHPHHSTETPVTPEPAKPSPPCSDHDQDAVYVGSEPLAAPLDRIQAPEPTVADWFLATIEPESDISLVHLIEYRCAGPPGEGLSTSIDLRPHLLRV
ncbi:MAG: putative secreted protein [Planctomycetaceae bacterium]|nr:putative secreted protein [Planctomycetaceae bacterium]